MTVLENFMDPAALEPRFEEWGRETVGNGVRAPRPQRQMVRKCPAGTGTRGPSTGRPWRPGSQMPPGEEWPLRPGVWVSLARCH